MNCEGKYKKLYFMPPVECLDWAKKDDVDKAPIWCSVDLRDGNQALVEPMSLDEKLEFFEMLVKIGNLAAGAKAAHADEYAISSDEAKAILQKAGEIAPTPEQKKDRERFKTVQR